MENKLKYDVLIVGGGVSGCAAAYNCAKLKLKTLLVEKNNFLGGLMTGGLVVPIMKSSVSDKNCEYYKKLIETSKKYDAQITYKDNNDGWLNPELLKIVLDDILSDKEIKPNLDILFETNIIDVEIKESKLKKVILKNDILSIPIYSKYFIDATGSAEFSSLCGCHFLDDTKDTQKSSLRFLLGNVDNKKFAKFIKTIDNDEDITNIAKIETNSGTQVHFTTASTTDNSRKWALDEILKKGVEDGILIDSDRDYFQIFSVAASNNLVAFNCPRMNNYKNNPFKASIELIEARKAIYRLFLFVKKYFKGFENAEIVNIASQTGIREQRRVKTKYVYTKSDLLNNKRFEHPILNANYSIDIHSDKKTKTITESVTKYEFPIESLMSYDINNLFVIGKIMGADFEAHSALRVQKSCMSMAEGTAKYIANNLF